MTDVGDLVDRLLDGDHRALARAITTVENREPGYRELVSALHRHTGSAEIIGVTGSPGSGKSTLVDKLAKAYRDRGLAVGVIAVDPSSPYTGGAVLGDRVRMASTVGDMDVFVRSMSARGHLGGLSAATTDAVTALDAFGKDRIVIETVGAGQNEVDVVRTADTVAVLVQPGSGDDVQMLKAGILEIGDVFVVNKADKPGADRTVQQLREMLGMRGHGSPGGHHAARAGGARGPAGDSGGGAGDSERNGDDRPTGDRGSGATGGEPGDDAGATDGEGTEDGTGPAAWEPAVVETVATEGTGVDEVLEALAAHREYLEATGRLDERARDRYAEVVRTLLRDDVATLVEDELDARGGMDSLVDAVVARETDPYAIADEVLDPVAECLAETRDDEE